MQLQFALLVFVGFVFAVPPYNFLTPYEIQRISECARLAGHFSNDLNAEVYKSLGCDINRSFKNHIVSQVLSGVNLTVNQIETSFKKPIEMANFHVPAPWNKNWPEKTGHHPMQFNRKKNEETPTFMFSTVDGRFLIIPISKLDFESFPEGLPDYAKYMKATPNSLLIRVVGLFSVDYMHYAICVSPYNLSRPQLTLQLSIETTEENYPKHWGVYPLGNKEWNSLTDSSALPIAELDEIRFNEAYQKDMKFLQKQQYVNYEFLISTITGSTENIKKLESTYESHYSILFEGEYRPVSVSITNIFRKTKKVEKSCIYCQSFDLFRKSKVIYGNNESKKTILYHKK